MWRALVFFALVLGIVLSGLMLLRKTAGRPPVDHQRERPPPRIEKKDDDDSGW
jgi:hypothetical protein